MKRYQPTGAVYEYEDLMRESPEGEYVLASEAQAEIERLRGLVEAAFIEGRGDSYDSDMDHRAWLRSDALKSITHHTPTHNP